MRIRIAICVLLMILVAPRFVHAQTPATASSPDISKFTGVWRGQFDNLPGIDLVIAEEDHQTRGAILFYLHMRINKNLPYTSKPGLPEPIFNLRLNADKLTFQVSHRRAHPPRTLNDTPMTFSLKLIAPDQAQLVNESGGAPMVVLKRSGY